MAEEKTITGTNKDSSETSEKTGELPPAELPSVEDRQSFLACLACIAATAYDYELTLEGTVDEESNNNNNNNKDNNNNNDKDDNPAAEDTIAYSKVPPELQHETSMSLYLEDSSSDNDSDKEDIKPTKSAEETELETNHLRAIKIQEKMALAEQRHFVRRYKVAKGFVSKSAEHLKLPPETVRHDVLPMLDTLLEDGSSKTKETTSSSHLQQVLQNPESHALKSQSTNSLHSLEWGTDGDLQKHLSKLKPTPAYQCLSWLLFQHLLHSDNGGYDARIRFWFKSLAVTLWVREFEMEERDGGLDNNNTTTTKTHLQKATKKWESLETCCAQRLLTLAAEAGSKKQGMAEDDDAASKRRSSSLGSNIWKGVQIGGVGVGAGILLAVTGGLAAPGIAAGLAALGMGAVAGTFLSLASSAAVVSLFGVAGGSLAAYKMNRRVSGLTEFTIQQEFIGENGDGTVAAKELPAPQLFRTLAISGWLHDKSDFQRPWGVTPTDPPITDRVELLQRFYTLHNPILVQDAEYIWKIHKHNPEQLYKLLRYKYGCDPSQNLFAKDKTLMDGLTEKETQQLDQIIVAIGKVEGGESTAKEGKKGRRSTKSSDDNSSDPQKEKKKSGRFSAAGGLLRGWGSNKKEETPPQPKADDNSNLGEYDLERIKKMRYKASASDPDTHVVSDFETVTDDDRNGIMDFINEIQDEDHVWEPPAHLNTVWNYPKRYGGELYTIKWESSLLDELSDSMRDLALDLASSASQQIMKVTVASTLIFAAALPLAIVNAMNTIDGTWTLVIERADEAGKELARSLLVNKGGHRPVTLVGYSFGARIIYTALKELAQYQQKWEETLIELRNQGRPLEDRTTPVVCKVGDLEFDREPASIVEDAIMMGMPKYLDLTVWKACREVVAGRLVNVYSRKDKILSYMFKLKQILGSYQPVVGTCTVAVPGVENIDVTDLISSHLNYSALAGKLLQRVRMGQPVRSTSHALDEVALMEEAKNLAEKQEEQQLEKQAA